MMIPDNNDDRYKDVHCSVRHDANVGIKINDFSSLTPEVEFLERL